MKFPVVGIFLRVLYYTTTEISYPCEAGPVGLICYAEMPGGAPLLFATATYNHMKCRYLYACKAAPCIGDISICPFRYLRNFLLRIHL